MVGWVVVLLGNGWACATTKLDGDDADGEWGMGIGCRDEGGSAIGRCVPV